LRVGLDQFVDLSEELPVCCILCSGEVID